MKTSIIGKVFFRFTLILVLSMFLASCIVKSGTRENTVEKEFRVTAIAEGGIKDIVFYNAENDYYYINRGLEQGLNLDSLRTEVLNKTVTLRLAKLLGGKTSKHISQMALDDKIIYTEFD